MQLTYNTGHHAVEVIDVAGQIDASTAPELTTALGERIEAGSINVVLNLAGLEYTSSAGLRALLTAVKQARASGGDLRLAAVADRVDRVLDMSGFNAIIQHFPTVDDAVESFA